MKRSQLVTFVLTSLLALSCEAGTDNINGDLVNSRVSRTVDLNSRLPKVTSSIALENTGKSSVNHFVYAVDPSLSPQLAFVGAQVSLFYRVAFTYALLHKPSN